MKNGLFSSATMLIGCAIFTVGCGGEDPSSPTTGTPEVRPSGAVQSLRAGTFIKQDGPPTSGPVAIVKDQDGTEFVELGDEFVSDFATGTVVLYFAKSAANIDEQRQADAANVSGIVGLVTRNGRQYMTIPAAICSSAL